MIRPPDIIKTARLQMRIPIPADATIIYQEYAQDVEVTKFLVWRPHKNVSETEEFTHRCIQCWKDGSSFPWVIIRQKDSQLIGMLELRINKLSADLGYVIARDYWGNGYATEITKAVIEWALAQEGIYRVWATCDVENHASARVLEKAGMQREGILRRFIIHPNISNEPRDSFCYSKVK